MKLILSAIVFLNFCLVNAQMDQLVLDYNLIKKNILNHKSIEIKSEYTMFATAGTDIVLSTARGNTVIMDGVYNQSIEGITTIIHDERVIMIDPLEEMIHIDHLYGDVLSRIWSFELEQFSDFITKVDRAINGQYISYSIELQYTSISRFVMTFNSENYYLSKMELYYTEADSYGDDISETSSPRLEIDMTYDLSPSKILTVANNPYVNIEGQNVELKNGYSSFTLINNLLKE